MRISKKVVLEYLESVCPDWKTFEQIVDEIPIMFHFDVFELQDRLDRLCMEGKIEKELSDDGKCIRLVECQRYRINKKEEMRNEENGSIMRMFEDMEIIVPKASYKEAKELVMQFRENPMNTCCIVIAGYKAKSKQYYDELRKEWIRRGRCAFDPKDRPWIVAWKHGCGHLWKDNTNKKEHV